jgi:hypothetical protein
MPPLAMMEEGEAHMSDRTRSGDPPVTGSATAQGSTDTPQGTVSSTTTVPPATLGQQPPQPAPPPDRLTPRIGIITLGVVALLCVIALIYLSARPEPPGTEPQPAETEQPTQTGPVAVEVANDTASLGLLGQIVGVLGTVAAAAIGGIAGFLTAARTTGTTEQQQSGTAGPSSSGSTG